ncbi:hypothetical protein T01_3509 [Trichinella spiralis]|uniref:Uncharacterized protein n=1 Tax=Trichinella spiralis TaxID=6334 RepID=A0A0V1AHL0_TRISP|nr:hypothetical protein T01_3509 [Trichinella spiralis]
MEYVSPYKLLDTFEDSNKYRIVNSNRHASGINQKLST